MKELNDGMREIKLKKRDIQGETMEIIKALEEKLPPKTAYRFGRYLDRLKSEFNAVDKGRMRLLDKFANKDAKGKLVILTTRVCTKCQCAVSEGCITCPGCEGKEFETRQNYDVPDSKGMDEAFHDLLEEEFVVLFKPIPLTEEWFGKALYTAEQMLTLSKFIIDPEEKQVH